MGTTHAAAPATREHAETKSFWSDGYGWKSWLLTVDHKRIAILYLISVVAFFAIGASFAASLWP